MPSPWMGSACTAAASNPGPWWQPWMRAYLRNGTGGSWAKTSGPELTRQGLSLKSPYKGDNSRFFPSIRRISPAAIAQSPALRENTRPLGPGPVGLRVRRDQNRKGNQGQNPCPKRPTGGDIRRVWDHFFQRQGRTSAGLGANRAPRARTKITDDGVAPTPTKEFKKRTRA
jgi:hypothetical protein